MFKRGKALIASLGIALSLLVAPVATPQLHLSIPVAHASAGNWTLVNGARTNILNGNIKSGDSFKVALFSTSGAVTTSSTTYSGLSGEEGTSNTGYTTGGVAVTLTLSGTTSVTEYFASNPQWTAGTANLAVYQAALYDVTSGYIEAFVNLDSGGALVTTTSGQTLTIADASGNPVLTFS